MNAHRGFAGEELAVGVEGAAGHKFRLTDELGTVAGLKGLLDGRGVGERFRRSAQTRRLGASSR